MGLFTKSGLTFIFSILNINPLTFLYSEMNDFTTLVPLRLLVAVNRRPEYNQLFFTKFINPLNMP